MSFRISRGSVPFLVLFSFLGVAAFSQTFRGGISGTITDPSGAAVAGASVQALSTATGLRRDTTTSTAGEFVFQDLPLGEYQLTASHPGFDQIKVDKVQAEVGKATNLRLTLKVAC